MWLGGGKSKFLSLFGLDCSQLWDNCMSQWPMLGQPVLGSYTCPTFSRVGVELRPASETTLFITVFCCLLKQSKEFSKPENKIPQGKSTKITRVLSLSWNKGNTCGVNSRTQVLILLVHFLTVWISMYLLYWVVGKTNYICEKCYKTIKCRGAKYSKPN